MKILGRSLSATRDHLLMRWFQAGFEREIVTPSKVKGYDGFVEEAKAFGALEDRARYVTNHFNHYLGPTVPVVSYLMQKFPQLGLALLRAVLPTSLHWLIGKSVATSNGLHIEKCKFLIAAGNASCVELCKKPTESYFRQHLAVDAEFSPCFNTQSCNLNLKSINDAIPS